MKHWGIHMCINKLITYHWSILTSLSCVHTNFLLFGCTSFDYCSNTFITHKVLSITCKAQKRKKNRSLQVMLMRIYIKGRKHNIFFHLRLGWVEFLFSALGPAAQQDPIVLGKILCMYYRYRLIVLWTTL